jgi:hypothetical protein
MSPDRPVRRGVRCELLAAAAWEKSLAGVVRQAAQRHGLAARIVHTEKPDGPPVVRLRVRSASTDHSHPVWCLACLLAQARVGVEVSRRRAA